MFHETPNIKVEKVIKSPINFSKSKNTFSFQKGKRFQDLKNNGSRNFTYEIPLIKNKKSASMGFGQKWDFIIKHINKEIPFYNIPSEFSKEKPSSPSYSFGIGRKYYDKVNQNLIFLTNLRFMKKVQKFWIKISQDLEDMK
jgi:hypothetical protein